MIKNIKVWQLKETESNKCFFFMPLRRLKKLNLEVSLKNYESIYKEHIIVPDGEDDYDTLENLYIRFQGRKPATYRGHSLSVSDIIEIDGIHYYCDSIGFEKL